MQSQIPSPDHGIALFIDIENFLNGCSSLGMEINLKPVCQKLQEIAPVRLRRAYGDIIKVLQATHKGSTDIITSIVKVRHELANNMVAIEDVPYIQSQKNSSDMILSSAALALAYENPNLTHFAFISNDKDYIPIYQRLREKGKFVIAICVGASDISSRIIDAVDLLFYYEDVIPGVSLKTNYEIESRNTPDTAVIPLGQDQPGINMVLQDSYELLVRAYKSLEMEGRTTVLPEILVQRMRQIRAEFD